MGAGQQDWNFWEHLVGLLAGSGEKYYLNNL
jgi:hypothetical protein